MKSIRLLLSLFLAAGISIGISSAADQDNSIDLVGVWNATASSDGNSRQITWTFRKEDGKLTAVSFDKESSDTRTIDRVSVKDKKLTLELDIEQDGNKGTIKVEAEAKSPGSLVGKWTIVGDNGTEYLSGDVKATKELSLVGEWDSTATLPDGNKMESVLTLSGSNSSLKGIISGRNGELEIKKATATESGLKLEFAFESDSNTVSIAIESKAEGNNKLVGHWVVLGEGGEEVTRGDWSAARKVKTLAGTWDVVAEVPDNPDYKGTMTLAVKDGSYSGSSTNDDGKVTQLTAVKVDGNKIELSLPIEADGFTGKITVQAAQQDDGSLKGEWILIGDDGNEAVRKPWKATRQ